MKNGVKILTMNTIFHVNGELVSMGMVCGQILTKYAKERLSDFDDGWKVGKNYSAVLKCGADGLESVLLNKTHRVMFEDPKDAMKNVLCESLCQTKACDKSTVRYFWV